MRSNRYSTSVVALLMLLLLNAAGATSHTHEKKYTLIFIYWIHEFMTLIFQFIWYFAQSVEAVSQIQSITANTNCIFFHIIFYIHIKFVPFRMNNNKWEKERLAPQSQAEPKSFWIMRHDVFYEILYPNLSQSVSQRERNAKLFTAKGDANAFVRQEALMNSSFAFLMIYSSHSYIFYIFHSLTLLHSFHFICGTFQIEREREKKQNGMGQTKLYYEKN